MATLSIHLLGSPRVDIDGSPLRIQRRKSLALLAYLAVTGAEHRRDALATLLWPESSQEKARGSLRRELSSLNHNLNGDWLLLDRETAALNPAADIWVDVLALQDLLSQAESGDGQIAAGKLSKAAELYHADFLAGFTLAGCYEFDEWQFYQAEGYRLQFVQALDELASLLGHAGDYDRAIDYARRRLLLDPLHEPAHQQLMRFYAVSGRQAAALRQYDECARILLEELGVKPDAETNSLMEEIRSRRLGAAQPQNTPAAKQPAVAPIPATDELRTVSVLVAALPQEDEQLWELSPDHLSELAGRLSQLIFPVLERHGATFKQLLDGGIVAVFGAIRAHEDDPERALSTALEIARAAGAQKLPLAMGVATGLAYVKNRAEGDVVAMGTTVNFAARLQANADTGETLVDEITRRSTRNAFRFASRSVQLPARGRPMPCHALVQPRRRPAKGRGIEGMQAELVGRETELATVKTALNGLFNGEGSLVTVNGEAGVGKSRLVAEAYKDVDIESGDAIWLEGRCLEMTSAAAYAPFIGLLRSYLAVKPGERPESHAGRLTDLLHTLSERGLLDSERLEWTGTLLANLLSLPLDEQNMERLAAVGPEQTRVHSLQALKDFFSALARYRPLVLVLEDLHWADELSIDLIGLLMEVLNSAPILLICVYRPEQDARCVQLPSIAAARCPARLREIRLRELTPKEAEQMIGSLLTGEREVLESYAMIAARSQGNPFFLEEIVHDLIDAGEFSGNGSQSYEHESGAVTDVPETVQNLVLSRLDRLEPATRQVAQAAAVMGRYFVPSALELMLPAELEVDEALADLEEVAFIYRDQVVPETVYAFRHVLARDAVYATLPQQRQRSLHGRLGQAIETLYASQPSRHVEELAYHFERSEHADRAVHYLLHAAEKARRAYLNEAAVEYYQHALSRLPDLSDEQVQRSYNLKALTGLGQLYSYMSRFKEAEDSLRGAIALGKQLSMPKNQLIRLYLWLGDLMLNYERDMDECLTLAQEGLALLNGDEESAEAAMMLGLIGFAYDIMGNGDAMIEIGARVVRFLERIPYVEELRIAYDLVCYYFDRSGDRAGMTAWMENGMRVAEEYHDLRFAGECTYMLAGESLFFGRGLSEALAKVSNARNLFERVGDLKRVQWTNLGTGYALLAWGQLESAQRKLAGELDAARELNPEDVGDLLRLLGIIQLAQGDRDAALHQLEESQRFFLTTESSVGEACAVLGHAYLWASWPELAIPLFKDALREELAREVPHDPFTMRRSQFMPRFIVAEALSGLERALGDGNAFIAYCEALLHGNSPARMALPTQPYLKLLETVHPDFDESPGANVKLDSLHGWTWLDADGDMVDQTPDVLTIRAQNMRNMWRTYVSAPRLVCNIEGDFILQVRCSRACTDRPAIGGIFLEHDDRNYLRLDWGTRGSEEISFQGSLDNLDVVIGRGLLHGPGVTLRLTRVGACLRAYCTADEEQWYSVGQIDFPQSETEQVGLFASGTIDRLFYPGAFPDGTALSFDNLHIQTPCTKSE